MVSKPTNSCALPLSSANITNGKKRALIYTNLDKNRLFITTFTYTVLKRLVKNIKYLLCLVFVVFACSKISAWHIIGGELIYDHLGNDQYKITLKIYRDCSAQNAAPFDGTGNGAPAALVTIFDVNGNFVNQLDLGAPTISLVPGSITNACISILHPCVEEGIYTTTTTIAPLVGGHTLVYQRCCRNAGVDNLLNSSNQGSSYTAFIPGPEVVSVNSSPRFSNFPPIDICNNMPLVFDHSATDPDGDVLVYKFSKPFDGLDQCCPSLAPVTNQCNTVLTCPTIPQPPPYQNVTYAGAFNENYAVASNPSLTIDPNTGLIQGKPNLIGNYVVGVSVEEWRGNVLLSTHYRDFQFTVSNCTVAVLAQIADDNRCVGQTITFTNTSINQSQTPSYFWNFGDPSTTADTSLVKDPTYTYQDTGVYNVRLIVNRGDNCTDTVEKTVYVYPPLDISFAHPNVHCVKSNSVNFSVVGSFVPSQATFNWSFPSAIPPTSTSKDPANISFTSAGLFSITLTGKQFACRDTFIDTIRILHRPIAKINNFPTSLCDPGTISFSNGSSSEYAGWYSWYMGNASGGYTYNDYEPTHTFSPAGNYNVVLTMYRGAPCPDTSVAVFSSITINPLPVPGFNATPSITTIFDPEITIESTAEGGITFCNYQFGDGASSYQLNTVHEYATPGKYLIKQTVANTFSCTATAEKEIRILPEFRFWAPNAFTPDENNVNEIFTPVTIGASNYKLMIYDRWGHLMFESTEANKGWDGKIKGKVCKQDVYVWKCTFTNDVTEKREMRIGRVTLLKASDEF